MNARAIFAIAALPAGFVALQIPVLGMEALVPIMVVVYVVSGVKYVYLSVVALLVSSLDQLFALGNILGGPSTGFEVIIVSVALSPFWWVVQSAALAKVPFFRSPKMEATLNTLRILRRRWR